MPDTTTGRVPLDPHSALTPAELAAVHTAADAEDEMPFTDYQRDRLRQIFGPAVRRMQTSPQT
jgi:dGTP triphosphohydrolase